MLIPVAIGLVYMLANTLGRGGIDLASAIGIYFLVAIVFAVCFAIPLCVITPTIWFMEWRRLRRELLLIKQGKCGVCGYDLTGNETGECPECGEETASDPA